MYDPVTARFLQADTYAGSQSDSLSLNLYTYCMNNPERYIDPSGHIAIELAVIVISAVVAGMAVEAGIQKFIEKKVCIDYNRIVGEGLFSGAISAISFGTGNLLKCTIGPLAAKNALSTGTGLTAKTLAAALIANASGGAASEAAEEMAHQFFVEGRTFSQIDYRQIGISAALGTVVSAGSTLAGAGIKQLKAKRAAKAAGGIVGNVEDTLPARMQLQYFAGEADGSAEKRNLNVLALPAPGEGSFNIGERLVSKEVFEKFIQGKTTFSLGTPGVQSFFFNRPDANTATRSFEAAVNAGFTRENILDVINNGGNELVRIRFDLTKVNQIVIPGVSRIPDGIGDGIIPGINKLFTGKGYTKNYLGKRGYAEYIAKNVAFTQDDIISYQYLGKIKK